MNIMYIKGSGGSISVHIVGYENPRASDTDDANWLISDIEIIAGPFSGKYRASLATHDFSRFQTGLAGILRTFNGKAVFSTYEESLHLEVEITSRGTVTVSGEVRTHGMPKAKLSFAFETDQTLLSETLQSVSSVVQDFPVRA